MNHTKVSVIVPIYNGEKYIENCVKCIINQTYQEWELILVNDGSKDSTGEMCDKIAESDDRIRVIHQENKGLSGARNTGIMAARGDYVWFFDVDDTVTDTLLGDNYSLAIEHNADLVMFGFWYYDVDKDFQFSNPTENVFVGSKDDYFYQMLLTTMDKEIFNAPWNKMIRRSILVENDIYFEPEYPIYEDIIFAPKILGASNVIVINNKEYYKYYIKSSGSLITSFKEKYFDCVTRYHANAMKYCALFGNNEKQIRRMNSLYTRLTYTHIKQICCKKDLSKAKKKELLGKIYNSDTFLSALDNSDAENKKKVINWLIHKKRIGLSILFYNIVSCLQIKK